MSRSTQNDPEPTDPTDPDTRRGDDDDRDECVERAYLLYARGRGVFQLHIPPNRGRVLRALMRD